MSLVIGTPRCLSRASSEVRRQIAGYLLSAFFGTPATGSQRCPIVVFFGIWRSGRHGERDQCFSERWERAATVNVTDILRGVGTGSPS